MNDQTPRSDSEAIVKGDLTRRTVLRTAAHAAWAVPVITAVSAAPAFAASAGAMNLYVASASATLSLTKSPATGPTSGYLATFTVSLENKSALTPATGLTVTLSGAGGGAGTYKGVISGTAAVTSPAGWTASSGKSSVTVTGDLGAKGTVTLVFSFKVDDNPAGANPAVPITVFCAGFTQTGVATVVPGDVP